MKKTTPEHSYQATIRTGTGSQRHNGLPNLLGDGRAMGQGLVADFSPRRPRFAPQSIHMGFLVEKVALGQVFLRVFRFFPVNIIPPWLSILTYHPGNE
jgi:hypothetical protein